MVICNDHCKTMFFSKSDCFTSCNSIITCKDRINLILYCLLNDIFIDPVTIFHTVWNLKINHSTKIIDCFP